MFHVLLVCLALLASDSCKKVDVSKKPNIILIMCDQFRSDRLGCMGDRLIKTPNIDQLAMEGIVFTNAYCPSPVCGPSRAALKTGLFPPGNGMVTNWVPFKEKVADSVAMDEYLLTNRLKTRGYHTAMVGKLHFYPAGKSYGFDYKMLHDAPYSTYTDDHKNSEYNKWLEKTFFADSDTSIVEIFDRDEGSWSDIMSGKQRIYDFQMGSGWRTEEQHDITWTANESIKYIDQTLPGQPFFLFTSF